MLKPIRNERGYFIIAHTEGGEVPQVFSNQVWLSEKEATLAVTVYMQEKLTAKKESPKTTEE